MLNITSFIQENNLPVTSMLFRFLFMAMRGDRATFARVSTSKALAAEVGLTLLVTGCGNLVWSNDGGDAGAKSFL